LGFWASYILVYKCLCMEWWAATIQVVIVTPAQPVLLTQSDCIFQLPSCECSHLGFLALSGSHKADILLIASCLFLLADWMPLSAWFLPQLSPIVSFASVCHSMLQCVDNALQCIAVSLRATFRSLLSVLYRVLQCVVVQCVTFFLPSGLRAQLNLLGPNCDIVLTYYRSSKSISPTGTLSVAE